MSISHFHYGCYMHCLLQSTNNPRSTYYQWHLKNKHFVNLGISTAVLGSHKKNNRSLSKAHTSQEIFPSQSQDCCSIIRISISSFVHYDLTANCSMATYP
eukprot:TRINITY_DN16765_c0_g2_i2.p1 TRINITY_DN16765_c0_g2~~TRINITY_DN16765_c0_g2_i2.p1  ORF type:complete len:100 (-),score=7.86 TRINITY_DN16765_c0_g2_i2:2128-2427(-)